MKLDQLKTLRQIHELNPDVFPMNTLRWWFFNREKNGLASAVFKAGGKVLVDQEKFAEWIIGNGVLEQSSK